jgi:peroxiredoxin
MALAESADSVLDLRDGAQVSAMDRRTLLHLFGLTGTAVLAGCATTGDAVSAKPQHAPDFSLNDLSGELVNLSDFRGKVVLVDFWGTYCPPCMEAIPDLVKLRNQLHPAGFEIIGVACDPGAEGKGKVAEVLKKLKITYPVVRVDDKTAEAYAVNGLPALFLIDRQGNVLESYVGSPDHDALEARIRGLVEDGGWRAPAVRS